MLDRFFVRAACCATLTLAAGASHAACTITPTLLGPRITGCNLAEITKLRFEGTIDREPDPLRFRLPNLRIDDVDVGVNGGGVFLQIDILNDGNAAAGLFDAVMLVSVHNPLAGGAMVGAQQVQPVQTVQALGAGQRARASMGWLGLPNRDQDWDVCTVALVDPLWGGGPRFGRVYEGNEGDNQRSDCCRVYGPKPDQTGPRQCW